MERTESFGASRRGRKLVWVGWVLSALLALLFGFSGVMKFVGGPELEQGIADLGLSMSMVVPLGILELTCLALFLIPPTSVVGAILLTGYLGGAICTHWRVGDWFILHIALGIVIWLAMCLREPRLWALIPLRRKVGRTE